MADIYTPRYAVFLFAVMPLYLLAQLPGIRHYGVKDGLPATTIYTISQDRQGFIWLGTEAGLVRFDGSEFKTISTKNGLPDNEVLELCLDSMDRLWITTYNRSICYIKNNEIHTAKNDSLVRALLTHTANDLISVTCGRGDCVWLYSKKLIRISGNKMHEFHDFAKDDMIRWVEDISPGNFNVYTNNSVYIFKSDSLTETKVLVHYPEFNTSYGIWHNFLYILGADSILIFKRSGYQNFALFKKLYVPSKTFGQNCTPGDNLIWRDSTLIVSAVDLGVFFIQNPLGTKSKVTLMPIHSTALFKDKDGNIWIATSDNGLFFYPPQNAQIIDHTTGLKEENTGCVALDDSGRVWLGDAQGALYIYSRKHIHQVFKNADTISYCKSRKIVCDNGTTFFISDAGGFVSCPASSATIPLKFSTSCKSIANAPKRNKIVIGTAASIAFVDREPPFHTREVALGHRVTALCEDEKGKLYCGSIDGLYVYDDSLRFADNTNELLKKRITCLAFSKNNIIWIGTSSNGIIALRKGKVLANISSENNESFSGVMCRSIFIDGVNNCWAATNSGLNKIEYLLNGDSLCVKNITPYFTQNGLADNDVNDVFVRDSMVYAATAKGVSIFNYYKTGNHFEPRVYITGVTINNIDTPIAAIYTLPYSQNNITIRFTCVSFTNNLKTRYRYKLAGADNSWSYTHANMVELKSLRGGSYTFIVEALDEFGNATDHSERIVFNIIPPFYLKWWSLGIAVLLFTFIIYILTRWWVYRKQKNERTLTELKQKIRKLEQQALRAQMNPHFIFNSLTAIQHFINAEDTEAANTYLVSFAKLIRKTLDNSEGNVISVHREIEYLENYIQLEQMRFNSKFTYQITCAPEVNQAKTFIPVMLTQPFVENAIRHGLRYKQEADGYLLISFSFRDNFLICKIEDNGVGREMAELLKTDKHIEYQSKGMKISQERIEAMNNMNIEKIRIEIIDKKNTRNISEGTLVTLYFG